eukprot:PhM_4_TR9138/c0_g1_i1/m.34724/K03236/EIF1A; translation initiation factor 1A
MPGVGKGKGGKNRKKGKAEVTKRELITREDGQEYGICTAMLGCNNIKVHLFSGSDVIGVIRGKIVRRMWINIGNVVLCGNREFQSGSPKVDIILRYTPDEAQQLYNMGEIPDISRWSVVGRGGVQETEENATGNVKFTSEAAATKDKVANDGWDMPSSSDEEDEEGSEEEDASGSDEEGPEELQPEIEYHKDDRHGRKQNAKASHKRVGDKYVKEQPAPVPAKGKGQGPATVVPQQRRVQAFEELDIDAI